MTASSGVNGGCNCGAITYSCESEPTTSAVCHCTVCQKQSASAFSINVGVAREDLVIEGNPTVYRTVGEDSGAEVERKFCGACGSPIVSLKVGLYAALDRLLGLRIGAVDDLAYLVADRLLPCWKPFDVLIDTGVLVYAWAPFDDDVSAPLIRPHSSAWGFWGSL